MHEYSLAKGIVDTILGVAKEYNATKIKKVEILAGEFSMINFEQLKFAFEIASEGTIAEGAELDIEEDKGRIKCEKCHYEGPIEKMIHDLDHFIVDLSNIFECPNCHSNLTKIVGGRDVYVKNIEAEVDEMLPEAEEASQESD